MSGYAVVVKIDEPGAPTDKARFAAEAGLHGDIFEVAFAVVAVEAGGLVLEMGLHEVDVAVEIVVAHARRPCRPSVRHRC